MDLERRDIEKRDFSQAKRGYNPDEVNRHLSAVASAVEELRRTAAQPQPTSLAGAAAARVETIVGAAEAEAQSIREQAERDAAEHVRGAEETVASLKARADELQREVDALVGSVGGLKAAVDGMRTDLEATAPAPETQIAPAPEAQPAPEPEPEPEAEPEPVPAAAEPAARGNGASEGARLVALNMALSGTPREETARYLRENFAVDDQDALLDDVYAKVGS